MENEKIKPVNPEEKVTFPPKKQEVIDNLLEERKYHSNKVAKIDGQLDNAILNMSDSENKDEQHINVDLIQISVNNPLINKKLKEEDEIRKIDQDLKEETK